jgi:hypothetical protein
MVEYYREGAPIGAEAPTDTRTAEEILLQSPGIQAGQAIHTLLPPERSDVSLAFLKVNDFYLVQPK